MRPKKASTLVKKAQNLIRTKQNFNNQKPPESSSQVNKLQSTSSINRQLKLVSEPKINSQLKFTLQSKNIIPSTSPALTPTLNRPFSRKTKNNSVGTQKLQSNFAGKNIPIQSKSIMIDNINQKTTTKCASKLGSQTYQTRQSTNKATNRNLASRSIQKQTVSKDKVNNLINPEESKTNFNISTRNSTRLQMLNTRKSKFQTDINKKNTLNGLIEKEKTSLIIPKNINIHKIKNSHSKNTQEKGQRVQQEKGQRLQQEKGQSVQQEKTQLPNQSIKQQREQKKTKSRSGSKQQKNSRQKQSYIVYVEDQPEKSFQTSQNHFHQVQKHSRHQFQSQQMSISVADSLEQENNFFQNQRNLEQIDQPFQQERPNLQQAQSLLQVNQRNEEVTNSQPQIQIQSNLDLTSLIANTQDIIDFINRLNLNNRTQPFDLMVGQLVQLNLIAQQVHELGQLGNNLGYSLVNVFGTRIRELQTTIINQVGQALLVSFSERMDPQFQALVMRQPSLRNGFSKADIEKTFEENITLEQVECSICLENLKTGQFVIELQCYHGYHPICIKTWLQNSKKCPMCRNQQKRKQPLNVS